ncbi:30S ribosomal protein S15 [Candidatus Woesearchaeota archaeon]|nr:30S ribosomal protein S15 [Candidatus Woesearchaeota archaeon]MBW3014029.1 30S ribosomal protein S15 [Candidatus Woesearchaeota archaeon]
MARMHSRDKGKSASKKPLDLKPTWVSFKQKEVEMLVVKLAKQGLSPSQIGLHLRDSYGIPDVKAITGKKINVLLKEKKLAKKLPEDLTSLIKRAIAIRKHLATLKKDKTARRGLTLTESKIKRLMKYYKKTGVLDEDWYYDLDRAELLIE